jgi:hypothetical protein
VGVGEQHPVGAGDEARSLALLLLDRRTAAEDPPRGFTVRLTVSMRTTAGPAFSTASTITELLGCREGPGAASLIGGCSG